MEKYKVDPESVRMCRFFVMQEQQQLLDEFLAEKQTYARNEIVRKIKMLNNLNKQMIDLENGRI